MSWSRLAERHIQKSENSDKRKSGDASNIFMSMKGGGKFTVRFVGEAKEKYILWNASRKYVVPDRYIEKLKTLGLDVRTVCVSNVIDRDDSKLRFKLLEKGPKVYGPVLTRYNEVLDDDQNKIHPGGMKGDDWRIIVSVPKDPRNTNYEVSNLKPTPFKKEEIELINRGKKENQEKYKDLPLGERGLIDIDKIYDEEKYVEALDKLIAEKESEMSTSEPKEASKASSVSEEEDPLSLSENEEDSPDNSSTDDDISQLW
jgi:hypothetical protein